MTDIERQQIDERLAVLMEQWPTLTHVMGCIDCHKLFRVAIDSACPLCGSKSILNVSEFFNEAKLKEKRETERASTDKWNDGVPI